MVKCLNIGKNIGKSIYRSISSLNNMKMKREIEDVQPFQIWQKQYCFLYEAVLIITWHNIFLCEELPPVGLSPGGLHQRDAGQKTGVDRHLRGASDSVTSD